MTIARRKAIDHHRARARRPEPRAELDEPAVTDAAARPARSGRRSARLSEAQRAAVALALRRRALAPRDRRRARLQRGRRRGGGWRTASRPCGETIDREELTRMSGIDAKRIARVLGADAGRRRPPRRRRALAERADREGLAEIGYATLETPARGRGARRDPPRAWSGSRCPTSAPSEVLEDLAAELSPRILELPQRLDPARRELDQYFEGRRERFDLALDWRLVRARVLAPRPAPDGAAALRRHRQLRRDRRSAPATRAPTAPPAARCGRNPIPIVVPCHRVLLAGGRLGNYGGGPGDEGVAAAARGRDRLIARTRRRRPPSRG